MKIAVAILFAVVSVTISPPARADVPSEARTLLKQLIELDTTNPPGNEELAANAMAKVLKDAGLDPVVVPFAPGRSNVVARLHGDGSQKPILLLAHLDVVGAAGQPWTVPPFKLTEKDGFLYGRGVIDDKGWVAIATAVFLDLARTHTKLKRDVILALTGDEESNGDGVRYLLDHRPELIADAEFAFNEGASPHLDAHGRVHSLLIHPAEKTYQNFELVARGVGGHSSMPNDENAIYRLADVLSHMQSRRFPAHLSPAIRGTLLSNVANANEPLKSALIKTAALPGDQIPEDLLAILDQSIAIRTATRTTCVATMISGGTRVNALPIEAHANINCRLLPSDTPKFVMEHLVGEIPYAVEIHMLKDVGSGPEVPLADVVRDALAESARAVFGPDVKVFSTLFGATTDSRFLRQRGMLAYNFGLLPNSESDAKRPHGIDERIPVGALKSGSALLQGLIRRLASAER